MNDTLPSQYKFPLVKQDSSQERAFEVYLAFQQKEQAVVIAAAYVFHPPLYLSAADHIVILIRVKSVQSFQ